MNLVYRILGISFILASALAVAADYPSRPVHLVLPFSAGGAADVVARTIAPALAERLGQPIVIENRVGAEGLIAGHAVATAPADGYMLLYAVSATAALPFVTKASYRATDLVPVTTFGTYDFCMMVSSTVPATSMSEFIAYAKANPGKLNYATLNVGEHFAAAQFMRAAGIEMTRVPYRSMAQILPDMASGQVHVNFGPLSNGMAIAKGGHARVLAVLSRERSPLAPDIPTLRESGLGNVAFESVQMLFARAGTSPEIVAKLSREVKAVLTEPEVRSRLEKVSLRVRVSTPDELRHEQAAANEAWTRFAADYHLNAN